jgi:two-component system cell cycle sensor histidine kinase/response regulator CckA
MVWRVGLEAPIGATQNAGHPSPGAAPPLRKRLADAAADARAFEDRCDGILVIGADLLLLAASGIWVDLFGTDPDRTLGRPVLDVVRTSHLVADDAAILERGLAAALQQGSRAPIALHPLRSDAGPRHFEGRPYGPCDPSGNLVVVFHDVTSQWSNLTELVENEQRFRMIAEAARDMVTESTPEGRFTFVSSACTQVLGYSEEELLSRSPLAIHHDDDRSAFLRAVRRDPTPGRPFSVPPHRLRRRDGSWVWVEATGVRYQHPNGESRLIGVARDISARLSAEDSRRQLEEQVRRAQRLESLGMLAGGIAHDFNNFLTPIVGTAGLLRAELADDVRLQKLVETIRHAATRATALTEQILTYAGQAEPRFDLLDVSQVVDEMKLLLESTASHDARLHTDLDPELPPVRADRSQIGQVIMNLVANAAEALDGRSGSIDLRTRTVTASREMLNGYQLGNHCTPGHFVSLDIHDDGVGMDAETRERIFDPFFSTKFTGRGLGLAVVLGIVRNHRGALRIESELGRGTTFGVLLPVVADARDAWSRAPAASTPSAAAWSGHGNILVVDDDDGAREIMAILLTRAGFDVRSAATGVEAVEILRRNPGAFRCVVLDHTMPGMSGARVFDAIHALDPRIPVVLASGYARERIPEELLQRGATCFLHKPFDASQLLAAVRGLLEPDA